MAQTTKKIFQRRDRLFSAGASLIVFFSIVTGIFNIGVLYLFGTPLLGLLAGIILVWISKTSKAKKTLFTLLPVPLVLITFLMMFRLNQAEPEIFLIPENYLGEITVFYDEPCGEKGVYEDDQRIYKLSEDGILITRAKKNSGYLNRRFYFTDSSGNRTEIPQFYRQNFDSEKRDLHQFDSNAPGELTKDTVGAFWRYGAETYGLSRNSLGYIISSFRYYEKPEKERWLEGRQYTKKAEELLRQCRQSDGFGN